jgi:ribosomal protein L7/L12
MQLTISEAENILSRVFLQELGGGKVSIMNAPNASHIAGPTVVISALSFDKAIRLMAKEPGLKIDAIKLYREAVPGTGLAEAKTYIEKLAAIP